MLICKTRDARLDEWRARIGTGHTVVDARNAIEEVHRLKAFARELLVVMQGRPACADLIERVRAAAYAPGEAPR